MSLFQNTSPSNFKHSVKFKGGLIYNKEGTAQINQDYIQYTRKADINALHEIAQRLTDSNILYKSYCSMASSYKLKTPATPVQTKHANLKDQIKPENQIQYIVTPLQHPLNEAAGVCTRLGARRVEIRDITTYDNVRTFANQNKIKYITAGIDYNKANNIFQFASDHVNARTKSPFPEIFYGATYIGKDHPALWEADSWLISFAPTYPLIYRHPAGNFMLRLADDNERYLKEFIMCEQKVQPVSQTYSPETNLLIQLAVHSCKRDMPSLNAMTEHTLKEIQAVTTLKFDYNYNQSDWNQFFPQFDTPNFLPFVSRRKRSLLTDFISNNTAIDTIKKVEPLVSILFRQMLRIYRSIYLTNYMNKHHYQNESSHTLQYENYIIHSPYALKSLPDFILALHSFWAIQRSNNYHYLTFTDWLTQQAQRYPIYAHFRRAPYIQRLTRDHLIIPQNSSTTPFLHYASINTFISDVEKLSDNVDPNKLHLPNITMHSDNNFANFTYARKKRSTNYSFGIVNMQRSDEGSYKAGSSTLPDTQTIELLKRHAISLSTLKINQDQIASVLNDLVDRISFFENQIIGRFDGVTAITMELDLKMLIRHLQTTSQITLLKYNSAFSDALDSRTSPYVLSQNELEAIATNLLKTKGYIVSTNIHLIKTYHLIENNEIHFIFDIPIIDPNKEFTLYTVAALPSFHDNVTYQPVLDSSHIALNQHGDKYTTLTDIELNKC